MKMNIQIWKVGNEYLDLELENEYLDLDYENEYLNLKDDSWFNKHHGKPPVML